MTLDIGRVSDRANVCCRFFSSFFFNCKTRKIEWPHACWLKFTMYSYTVWFIFWKVIRTSCHRPLFQIQSDVPLCSASVITSPVLKRKHQHKYLYRPPTINWFELAFTEWLWFIGAFTSRQEVGHIVHIHRTHISDSFGWPQQRDVSLWDSIYSSFFLSSSRNTIWCVKLCCVGLGDVTPQHTEIYFSSY